MILITTIRNNEKTEPHKLILTKGKQIKILKFNVKIDKHWSVYQTETEIGDGIERIEGY